MSTNLNVGVNDRQRSTFLGLRIVALEGTLAILFRAFVAALAFAAVLLTVPTPATASLTNNTIGATGTLGPHGRTATATALLECTTGQTISIRVTLTQDQAVGAGVVRGSCTGTLTEYPVRVTAGGAAGFTAGPAQACATAVNRDRGQVVDTKQWCRANPVQLTD